MSERKTVNVLADVKDDLTTMKNHLGVSNESDAIRFLLAHYTYSQTHPREAINLLLEMRK